MVIQECPGIVSGPSTDNVVLQNSYPRLIDKLPERSPTRHNDLLSSDQGLNAGERYLEEIRLSNSGYKATSLHHLANIPPLSAQKGQAAPLQEKAKNVSAWNAILQQSRPMHQEDKKLRYIAPTIVNGEARVVCPKEEFEGNLKQWQSTIIGVPVELGSMRSLMPLHSLTASALLTSMLASKMGSWAWLSEGTMEHSYLCLDVKKTVECTTTISKLLSLAQYLAGKAHTARQLQFPRPQ